MKRLNGLPPVFNSETKIMIFGTFPGCESLLHKEYYTNPRNQFWKIMKVICKDFDATS